MLPMSVLSSSQFAEAGAAAGAIAGAGKGGGMTSPSGIGNVALSVGSQLAGSAMTGTRLPISRALDTPFPAKGMDLSRPGAVDLGLGRFSQGGSGEGSDVVASGGGTGPIPPPPAQAPLHGPPKPAPAPKGWPVYRTPSAQFGPPPAPSGSLPKYQTPLTP